MPKYAFKFKYTSLAVKATGNGEVTADDIDKAFQVAARGVADDFGQATTNNVVITNMREKIK